MNAGTPTGAPIVEFIARQPGLAERLLAEHIDDGAGRCRGCTGGGRGARPRWPCPLHGLALRASQLVRDGVA